MGLKRDTQAVRTGWALEIKFNPSVLKVRKLKPRQATCLAHSTGTAGRDAVGQGSGLPGCSTHCAERGVSCWELGSCTFGRSLLPARWQSHPPCRQVEDGTRHQTAPRGGPADAQHLVRWPFPVTFPYREFYDNDADNTQEVWEQKAGPLSTAL